MPLRLRAPHPSSFAPEIRTISFHIVRSFAANAAASSGVDDKHRAPAIKKRSCTALSAAISRIAFATLSMIGRGVPAGNTKPAHEVTTKSLSPASAIVGTFGMLGQRCGDVTFALDNLASYVSTIESGALRALAVTSPESIAGIVCAAPRNGTCWPFTPVRVMNSAPERCGVVPTPGLP